MNVGNYVRTEYGIALIKSIREDRIIINLKTNEKYIDLEYKLDTCIIPDDEGTSCFCRKEDIIKSSPNIIDLIEVGDIITTINLCGKITKIDGDKIYTTCYDRKYCSAEDIKSIVTCEQFEAMQYKVGE